MSDHVSAVGEMASDDDSENAMVRKIYVLPRELVGRIAAFQQERNLPSEVEAVRRLLDEALMQRDSPELIVERFRERLKLDGIPSSVARDVLMGHPLVTTIDQSNDEYIGFTMKSGRVFRVHRSGQAEELDRDNSNYQDEHWDEFPPKTKPPVYGGFGSKERPEYDDDIPF